jgi:hypothetical protein
MPFDEVINQFLDFDEVVLEEVSGSPQKRSLLRVKGKFANFESIDFD